MNDAGCMPLRVECYSGCRADERPEAFWLCEHRVLVRQILDRWLDESYAYFKVTDENGVRHILRRDDYHDGWELILTEDPAGPAMEARG